MSGYSEADLVEFVDWILDKGLVKEATGRSRKVAVQKVLAALDDNEKNDLRSIDREAAFQRFVNKFSKDFSPESLATYKSRFVITLDDFLRFKENPAAFKPGGSQRSSKKQQEEAVGKSRSSTTSRRDTVQSPATQYAHEANNIPIPVFIRPDVVVRIFGIPHDLSKAEAEKIAAVVGAMAQ